MDKEENYAALRLTLRHLASLPAGLPPACLININDTRRRLEGQAGGENPRKRKQQKAALRSADERRVCEFCWNARDVRRDVVRCGGKKRGTRQQRVAISCGFCGRSYEEEEFEIVTKVHIKRNLFILQGLLRFCTRSASFANFSVFKPHTTESLHIFLYEIFAHALNLSLNASQFSNNI
jgi:hypothetical protein